MELNFYKYQGTGNDFIIIDNRLMQVDRKNHDLVKHLCDRRFGIGADGLMLLQEKDGFSFEMVYFNSDGRESSMCGNGGRCLVAFARYLGLVDTKARFTAIDGEHEALVSAVSETDAVVKLRMNDVKTVEKLDSAYFLDTGSPHYVSFRKDLSGADVYNDGRAIRYSPRFEKEGTNVNFVEQAEPGIYVRTYERGVEAETYSCGTGVTAAVLASYEKGLINDNHCRVKTLGGYLTVYFEADGGKYENIWLEGPATYVFKGSVNV